MRSLRSRRFDFKHMIHKTHYGGPDRNTLVVSSVVYRTLVLVLGRLERTSVLRVSTKDPVEKRVSIEEKKY